MINIKNKSDCSGCHACANICPKQCIKMEKDKEGFLYPKVNKTECIECGLCEKMCQSINPIHSNNVAMAYACYNKNEAVRMKSSSGGIFTLLAEYIIDQGGVVFGAAFDRDFNVKHISVQTKEELYLLRGSKYMQSVIGTSYQEAKDILESGRYVLFTGTPCQIDALLHFLKKEYDNLYTQDIICHGVPSSLVWQKYLEYHSDENKLTINRESLPTFRRKNEGWKRFSVSFHFTNDTEYCANLNKDLYMKAFLSNICLRPSCYNCHSKTLNRNSDITLADLWGCDKILPEIDDDKGVSLVFINSNKGKVFLNSITDKVISQEIDINQAVKYNSSAYKSVYKPINRKYFYKQINKMRFDKLVEKYKRITIIDKIKIKLKLMIKK